MFAALISYIKGGVRIEVRGLNLDRLLAALLKEGFVLRNLKRPSYQVLIFDVGAGQRKKAVGFLKKQRYEANVLKEFGLPGALRGLAARAGLLAGLLLCGAGVALYSRCVRDIRIEGIQRIQKADVTALLDGMGVKKGVGKKKLDNDDIAAALNTGLADAANVTVRLKGTSLIIRIYETLYKDPVHDPDVSFNIVSAYDAIVARVVALNGTALVGAGDIVRKGDILIAGYNLDAEGNMSDARAAGEVTGRVFFSADNVFFTVREEYVRTGNYKEKVSLQAFGLSFGGGKDVNPYPLYDKEETAAGAFKNFFVPVTIIRERYYELAAQTAEYDYETHRDGVISSVKAEAESKVPPAAEILSAKTDVRQIDKYVITVYNIETRMLING